MLALGAVLADGHIPSDGILTVNRRLPTLKLPSAYRARRTRWTGTPTGNDDPWLALWWSISMEAVQRACTDSGTVASCRTSNGW